MPNTHETKAELKNYPQGQDNDNLDQRKIVTLTQIQDRINSCLLRGIRGLDEACAVQQPDQLSCVSVVHASRESITLAPCVEAKYIGPTCARGNPRCGRRIEKLV